MEEQIIGLVRHTWYGDDPENQGVPAKPRPELFVGRHVNAYRVRCIGERYVLGLAEPMAHHIPLAIIQAANTVMEECGYKFRYDRTSGSITLESKNWERVFELIEYRGE